MLSILTRKWYRIKATKRICKFCNQKATEIGLQFLLDCPNYQEIKKDTFTSVTETHNINLKDENKIKKQLFSVESLSSLNFNIRKICQSCSEKRIQLYFYKYIFDEDDNSFCNELKPLH